MDTITQILAAIVIALISSIVTKVFFAKGVDSATCGERRSACTALLVEKIDAIHHRLDQIHNTGIINVPGRSKEREGN